MPPNTLSDLVSAGLLRLPQEIEATYKGRVLTGRIGMDHAVAVGGTSYPSLSGAVSAARGSVIGPSVDGKLPATNGWTFWHVRVGNELWSLDQLRERTKKQPISWAT